MIIVGSDLENGWLLSTTVCIVGYDGDDDGDGGNWCKNYEITSQL